MRKVGITSLNDDEIAEIFSSFDEEKKGEIDYREFVSELFEKKSLSKKEEKSTNWIRNEIAKDYTPEEILNLMREKLNERGVQGICSIVRNFRIIDGNISQTIDFS